jgi:hypothetical protein
MHAPAHSPLDFIKQRRYVEQSQVAHERHVDVAVASVGPRGNRPEDEGAWAGCPGGTGGPCSGRSRAELNKSAAHLVIIFLAFATTPAVSATAEEACPGHEGQLSIYYEIDTLPDRVAARNGEPAAAQKHTSMEWANVTVISAYGVRRVDLNKKWPGFYDWSQIQAADGIEKRYGSDEFKERAVAACLAKYS